MREQIISGLDLGSTNIRIVVGQKNSSDEKIHIIGAVESPVQGINRGVVTSIEEATSSITNCLEKAERLTGVPIDNVYLAISGTHINSQNSKGVIAVSKPTGEINEDDVVRAIDAARAVATPPNSEILHVIPRGFSVDSQECIKDPVGMTGIRLEVDSQIIHGSSSHIKNLTKCVYRTGLDIDDLVLSTLATSEAVLSSKQKELGVVVVNIGAATTGLAVFEEGDLLLTSILPIGSEHITSDIAIGLRTSIDIAEKIKLQYGFAIAKDVDKKEKINLNEFDSAEDEIVSRKYIVEIIQARVEEIFEKIDKELKKISRSQMLPAGIVLTGSGVKLSGIVEIAKEKLKLPVRLGSPEGLISAIDKVNDPSFATSVGLTLWGAQFQNKNKKFSISQFKLLDRIIQKIKKILKSIMP